MFWRKCHQRCLHGPQTHCLLKRQRLSVHWCISNRLSWNECGMNHNNNLGDGHSLCSSDVSRSGTTTRLMSLISVFHTLAAAAWQCFVHRLCFWKEKGIFFFFFVVDHPWQVWPFHCFWPTLLQEVLGINFDQMSPWTQTSSADLNEHFRIQRRMISDVQLWSRTCEITVL